MNQSATKVDQQAPVVDHLLFGLFDAIEELEDRLEAELERVGLSCAKASTLYTLARASEPLILSDLAAQNQCVRSNVTQLVDRLEADGLVRRVNDPDDRRIRRAALTTAGRKAYEDAVRVIEEQQQALDKMLSKNEAEVLQKFVDRVIS